MENERIESEEIENIKNKYEEEINELNDKIKFLSEENERIVKVDLENIKNNY